MKYKQDSSKETFISCVWDFFICCWMELYVKFLVFAEVKQFLDASSVRKLEEHYFSRLKQKTIQQWFSRSASQVPTSRKLQKN